MEFEKFLGTDIATAIIKNRMGRLAEQGFELQLNIEFLKDQMLDENITEQQNAELGMQLQDILLQAENLSDTIKWHQQRLERLTTDGE